MALDLLTVMSYCRSDARYDAVDFKCPLCFDFFKFSHEKVENVSRLQVIFATMGK